MDSFPEFLDSGSDHKEWVNTWVKVSGFLNVWKLYPNLRTVEGTERWVVIESRESGTLRQTTQRIVQGLGARIATPMQFTFRTGSGPVEIERGQTLPLQPTAGRA